MISDERQHLLGIVTQTQMLRLVDPAEMYHVMQQMQNVIEEQTQQLQRLNDELQVVNEELRQLAAIDELTQIANLKLRLSQSAWCNMLTKCCINQNVKAEIILLLQ